MLKYIPTCQGEYDNVNVNKLYRKNKYVTA